MEISTAAFIRHCQENIATHRNIIVEYGDVHITFNAQGFIIGSAAAARSHDPDARPIAPVAEILQKAGKFIFSDANGKRELTRNEVDAL